MFTGIIEAFAKVNALKKEEENLHIELESKLATELKIDQSVFDQISIYNLKIKSKYLMISNGLDHLYFKIDQVNKTHIFVKDFPL